MVKMIGFTISAICFGMAVFHFIAIFTNDRLILGAGAMFAYFTSLQLLIYINNIIYKKKHQ